MENLLINRDSDSIFFHVCYNSIKYKELYEKHYKLIKIEEGEAIFSGLTDTIHVKAGSMLFVSKEIFCKIKMIPSNNGLFKLIGMNFTDKFLASYKRNNLICNTSNYSESQFIHITSNVLFDGFFNTLSYYSSKSVLMDKKLLNLKIQEGLHIVSLEYPHLLSIMFSNSETERQDLASFMKANYKYNAPLKRFAELSGRSLTSFRRDFVKIFGTSPMVWLIDKRIEEGYRRITQEGCRPSDIYWEIGFETIQHFTRKFKEKYGITPSEARKKHTKHSYTS